MFGAPGVAQGHGVKLNDLSAIFRFSKAARCGQPYWSQKHGSVASFFSRNSVAAVSVAPDNSHIKMEPSELPDATKTLVSQAEQQSVSKAHVIIKKTVDKPTLWAVCRTLTLGGILIFLGSAMAGVGYYADEFAKLKTPGNNTSYVNANVKLQYVSLQYIGPIIMGVGAFLLMVACVMTLENRDKHIEMIREIPRRDDAESGPRKYSHQRKPTKRGPKNRGLNGEELTPDTLDDLTSPERDEYRKLNGSDAFNNNIRLLRGGRFQGSINRCFIRDDSKTGKDSDSSPIGPDRLRTTTYQTCFGLKHSLETSKYASTSYLDIISKRMDARELLQRFLEDQSELVSRMKARKILSKQAISSAEGESSKGSVSARGSSNISCAKSSGTGGNSGKHSIIAEIHHSSEDTPHGKKSLASAPNTSSKMNVIPSSSTKRPPLSAPIAQMDASPSPSSSAITLSLIDYEPSVYSNLDDSLGHYTSPMSLASDSNNAIPAIRQMQRLRVEEDVSQRHGSLVSITSYHTALMSFWAPPGNTQDNSKSNLSLDSNGNATLEFSTVPLDEDPVTPSTIDDQPPDSLELQNFTLPRASHSSNNNKLTLSQQPISTNNRILQDSNNSSSSVRSLFKKPARKSVQTADKKPSAQSIGGQVPPNLAQQSKKNPVARMRSLLM